VIKEAYKIDIDKDFKKGRILAKRTSSQLEAAKHDKIRDLIKTASI